jgi:hypothetical protein
MKKYTAYMLDCEDGSRLEEGGEVYLAADVDALLQTAKAALKRIASRKAGSPSLVAGDALDALVGGEGVEPPTSSMSTTRSTAELTAHDPKCLCDLCCRVRVDNAQRHMTRRERREYFRSGRWLKDLSAE